MYILAFSSLNKCTHSLSHFCTVTVVFASRALYTAIFLTKISDTTWNCPKDQRDIKTFLTKLPPTFLHTSVINGSDSGWKGQTVQLMIFKATNCNKIAYLCFSITLSPNNWWQALKLYLSCIKKQIISVYWFAKFMWNFIYLLILAFS